MHLVLIIAFAALLWFNSSDSMNLLKLSAGLSIAIVLAQAVLVVALASITARRTLDVLQRDPADPNEAQHQHHVWSLVLQLAMVGFFVLNLILTGWPTAVHHWLGDGLTYGLSDLLVLLPFALTIVAVWIAQYPADRAIRELALNPRLEAGYPAHPVWTLRQYLSFNIRYQLLTIAVPMSLIIIGDDVIDHYRPVIREACGGLFWVADALMGLLVCGVFIFAPIMLRYIWTTEPLPSGELRQNLSRIAAQMDLKYRDILVWHSQGMVVNAAVMGVFGKVRYVLISDGLLEAMSDKHIEAVFGHEAGHVQCWHIPYFVTFAMLTMLIAGGLMVLLQSHGPQWMTLEYMQILVGLMVVMLWTFAFGWLSHQFEHQADFSGALSITPQAGECLQKRPECLRHAEADGAGGGVPLLCATAAAEFSRALLRVAALNGIPTEEKGWRHPSIMKRITLLADLSKDTERSRRFMKTLWVVKVVLVAGTLVGLVISAYLYRHQLLPPLG